MVKPCRSRNLSETLQANIPQQVVIGTDVSRMQTDGGCHRANLSFQIVGDQVGWAFKEECFDCIYARDLIRMAKRVALLYGS